MGFFHYQLSIINFWIDHLIQETDLLISQINVQI